MATSTNKSNKLASKYISYGLDGPAPDIPVNKFFVGDATTLLPEIFSQDSIDLTVTSPPYDDLRNYNGFSFDPRSMLAEIYRVTKPGGVCVWVVGERISGERSLSSFEHAFIGREVGFNVHDVMIYQKKNTPFILTSTLSHLKALILFAINLKLHTTAFAFLKALLLFLLGFYHSSGFIRFCLNSAQIQFFYAALSYAPASLPQRYKSLVARA